MTGDFIAGVCLGYLAADDRLKDFSERIFEVDWNAVPVPEYFDEEPDNPWTDLYNTADELYEIGYDGMPFTENDLISAGINSRSDLLDLLTETIKNSDYYGT